MKQLIRSVVLSSLAVGVLATGMLATAPVIAAKGSHVVRTGVCSMSSDWKLKVGPDNERLEVEFEVDQNRNGQVWNVVLKHDGSTFWSGHKTTSAPSGSFAVHRFTTNAAGTDTIVGKATNPKTGEVCRGTVNI